MAIFYAVILALSAIAYSLFTLVISRGLLKKIEHGSSTALPAVAVIIAARNEAEKIGNLLADLLQQDYAGSLAIYVANDRSQDETGILIDQFARKHTHIHHLKITERSANMTPKKHALTQCIKRTSADIIVTTDADCRVGQSWVSSMVKNMDADTGIIVGYSRIEGSGWFSKYQALDFAATLVANAGLMKLGYNWSGTGQNLSYRRSAFTSIGGYNAVAEQVTGDDIYLVQTIPKKTGLKARLNEDPSSFVKTAPMATFSGFVNQRVRWASDARGMHERNTLFFIFLLSAFLTNAGILLGVVTGQFALPFYLVIAAKFFLEALVLFLGARKFKYGSLLYLYPLWFLLQPVYITYMGLMGLRGKFIWKP